MVIFKWSVATTYHEYQKYIEKDEALERRLARINVDEPSPDEAIAIFARAYVKNLKTIIK